MSDIAFKAIRTAKLLFKAYKWLAGGAAIYGVIQNIRQGTHYDMRTLLNFPYPKLVFDEGGRGAVGAVSYTSNKAPQYHYVAPDISSTLELVSEGEGIKQIRNNLGEFFPKVVTDLILEHSYDFPMPLVNGKLGETDEYGLGLAFFQSNAHGTTLRDLGSIEGISVRDVVPAAYDQIIQPLVNVRDYELYEGDIRKLMESANNHRQYLNSKVFKSLQVLKEGAKTSVYLYGAEKIMKFAGFCANSTGFCLSFDSLSEAVGNSYNDIGKIDNRGTVIPVIQDAMCSSITVSAIKTACVEVTNYALAMPKDIDSIISSTISTIQTFTAGDHNDAPSHGEDL
jgi:hypothetical protein